MEEFERSGESFERFCARRKVSSASLCKWRRQFAALGAVGLVEREPARNSCGRTARARSAEERRRAVEAYAQSGMTVRDFARTWGLSTKTMSRWLAIYRTQGPKGLEPRARGPRPATRAEDPARSMRATTRGVQPALSRGAEVPLGFWHFSATDACRSFTRARPRSSFVAPGAVLSRELRSCGLSFD
ncbi:MAG: helix-turn-helix domain-containing protein [Planctomycetes bacterium]|nr:helix-turn-helix domain-containing protein [Planctomycetota bacterium]